MKKYQYLIDGAPYDVTFERIEGKQAHVKVNGLAFTVEMLGEGITERDLPEVEASAAPDATVQPTTAPAAPAPATTAPAEGTPVKAPLPGVIVRVLVEVGQFVKKGDNLVVLEAMKMENYISAEASGMVTAVCCAPGDSVMEDTTLVTIDN